MKKIRVTLEDAVAEMHPEEKKETFVRRISAHVKSRLPRGKYFEYYRESARLCRSERTEDSKAYRRFYLLNLIVGKRAVQKLAPSLCERANRFHDGLPDARIPYSPKKYLYHFAPEESLGSIKKDGLIAGEKFVFTTNSPRTVAWFPAFKTEKLGRDTTFCLLKIDARRAAREHALYYYRLDQIVAEAIRPEYIIFE